ncbi:FmdB family zinc ribbon protein [Aeromicrobium endophyticum]|uniref:FmdB family transcriptional regulator n=1 Tax=Aeromicrobium endophyticum TaxID=2292704 RepID=A0A371PD65_9ACTN|nr:FmdB family zinc ribbon protein [Aeromicrobium endophyticum]REK73893.1 FmdB family transcriptional regulator [Aeromicrobium endophyticum]
MPKYQYQCKDCGEALEVQQSFTDDALTVCPTCGGDLRKVFNAVGVVFKGSGFYKTDSRSGSGSGSASSSSSSSSSSTGDSSSSTSSAKADSTSSTPAKPSTSTSSSGSGSAA